MPRRKADPAQTSIFADGLDVREVTAGNHGSVIAVKRPKAARDGVTTIYKRAGCGPESVEREGDTVTVYGKDPLDPARLVCAACFVPLDGGAPRDLAIADQCRALGATDRDLCDSCRLDHFGEGSRIPKIGRGRWTGGALKAARRRLGLTTREVGDAVEIAHTTIIRNERREAITAFCQRAIMRRPSVALELFGAMQGKSEDPHE